LRTVATQMEKRLSTACNQYQSAFRFIVGHDYTPELWFQVFGPLKLSERCDPDNLPTCSTSRPVRSRHRRPIPETTLARPGQGPSEPGLLNQLAIGADENEAVELAKKIHILIKKGRSNKEILQDLELEYRSNKVIDWLRERAEDNL
jgi:hypothetical protein